MDKIKINYLILLITLKDHPIHPKLKNVCQIDNLSNLIKIIYLKTNYRLLDI
jgi:hypothetical protein